MRRIDDSQRRARLAWRHHLAPGHRASDPVEAATSLVALHGTDPATVFQSARARVDGLRVADLESALYDERSLVKHLAMRRTVFVFPRPMLAAAQAAASDRVAVRERRALVRDVERAGLHRDGEAWLARASERVLEVLGDGRQATSSELREDIPELQGSITYGEGRSWGGAVAVGPRVLTVLSASGLAVRATNAAGWAASRPRWSAMRSWLGEELRPPSEAEGLRTLVRAWLYAFGPGTEADLRWWLGSTLTAVRGALAELDAVEVDLGGRRGYLLADDLEPVEPVEPWGALLPPLDPTTMGWIEREWYLGPYKPQLFDSTGNGGPAMWWDGRIVGGWRQHANGEVELQPLEDVGDDAMRVLEAEAERLTAWFGGMRVLPRFPSPLSKALGEPAG